MILGSRALAHAKTPVAVAWQKNAVRIKLISTKWGGKLPPFSDPDFDGKDPGEVVRMMGRAKRWLESRGFTIRLDGEYTKTTVHKLKF